MIDLRQGDCLELMKDIPDGSVDMILCDLPYGTMKGANLDGWDKKKTEWDIVLDNTLLFGQYERVLRENGTIVLFSQEPLTSKLRTLNYANIEFAYPMIWLKDHFANALISKKAPVSYFEDINVFYKKYDTQNKNELRAYSKEIFDYIGKTKKAIIDDIGQKADHFFRYDSMQFKIPTKSTYKELTNFYNLQEFKNFLEYETLKQNNSKYESVFNLEGETKKSNVLEFKKEYKRFHPTQKPVTLLEYLIKTYTNESDVVLDNCMGSGSTGVACKNLNRNFIGIELDENYFNIAKERIKNA